MGAAHRFQGVIEVTGRSKPCVVEVESSGQRWIKSSVSGGTSGDCVEISFVGDIVRVRNSRNRGGAQLSIPLSHWRTFVFGPSS